MQLTRASASFHEPPRTAWGRRSRPDPRVLAGRGRVRRVLIERPLHDVAEHVVEAPRVRFLRADLVIGPSVKLARRRVLREPGHVSELCPATAGAPPARHAYSHSASVGRRGSTRRFFALSHCAYLLAACCGHADGRKPAVAAAEAHLEVRRRRAAQPIDQRRRACPLSFAWSANMNIRYASHVTSWVFIQNASSFTLCCGFSSALRLRRRPIPSRTRRPESAPCRR